ncbi:hypothetical protein WN990_01265 [Kitasatospora purpeofusca]|uniref:hypothetical protein n=1 Tax=Kitasatospora purpeofusca TaxID=67352 RepID=UPI0030F06D28
MTGVAGGRRRGPLLLLVLALLAVAGLVGTLAANRSKAGSGEAFTGDRLRVQQDYSDYWKAMLAANESGDSSALADHAAGEQLEILRANLTALTAAGLVAKGSVDHQIRSITVDGNLATLMDCIDVDKWIQYEARSGRVQPGQLMDRPKQLASYTFAPRDGRWLVTRSEVLSEC